MPDEGPASGAPVFHARGSTKFGSQDLSAASEAELTGYRRRHVGFVFQFYNLIPSLTGREDVALVTDIVEDPMPVDEAIDRVGLTLGADDRAGATLQPLVELESGQ